MINRAEIIQFVRTKGAYVLFVLLLFTWPLAWKYTSLGLDVETAVGSQVECVFYRVRWPGDGSIMIGRIDEPLRPYRHPLERFDLGGVFFHPAMNLHPANVWERMGFRWVDYDSALNPGPCDVSPHAARVKLIGFPHSLIVLAAAAMAFAQFRRLRRAKTANDHQG